MHKIQEIKTNVNCLQDTNRYHRNEDILLKTGGVKYSIFCKKIKHNSTKLQIE